MIKQNHLNFPRYFKLVKYSKKEGENCFRDKAEKFSQSFGWISYSKLKREFICQVSGVVLSPKNLHGKANDGEKANLFFLKFKSFILVTYKVNK